MAQNQSLLVTGQTGQITAGFWGKKLHSLSGIIPVGVFLLEHIYTNSYAIYGAEAFNKAVDGLRSIPYVFFVEVCGIALPILYHALYGTVITLQGRPNNLRYRYPRNWMYLVQRVSGVFLIVYIIWHVWNTRIGFVVKGVPMNFEYMVKELSTPGMPWFYAAGMLTAVFHLMNGVWSFCIGWGIVTSEIAMKRLAWLCAFGGVFLAGLGINGLLGFFGRSFMINL
ncbi:MAG: hypothetical protein A2583_10755 [Bdellovibrionales bacterium RIFOXYD1_FULL_53_11]|nr:MAG: hypothetical protein A2583_10755 [Bdellovibrionales bacterium RIFOXYD1_FULL_53_11]